jgi:hypothetical protein
MPIDRNTSRRGVGSIKFILGAFVLLILAIPLLMGISGLMNQDGDTLTGGAGTAPAQTGTETGSTVTEPAEAE